MIGLGNHIREFATVNLPLPGGRTEIGSDCYVLAYAHVAHDVAISGSVTLATQALLGGHSEAGGHAYVGLGAETHQFTRIGRHAMVGMGSTILRDVPSYALMIGARFARINEVGMRRGGMSESEIDEVRRCCDRFDEIVKPTSGGGPYAEQVRSFMKGSKRGVSGRGGAAAAEAAAVAATAADSAIPGPLPEGVDRTGLAAPRIALHERRRPPRLRPRRACGRIPPACTLSSGSPSPSNPTRRPRAAGQKPPAPAPGGLPDIPRAAVKGTPHCRVRGQLFPPLCRPLNVARKRTNLTARGP